MIPDKNRGNSKIIEVARGDTPADLLFLDCRLINTFTGRTENANVAISNGYIAGVGDYLEAREVVDLSGKFLIPGLIDGHFHIESTHLSPAEYARAVVPRGVLTVITDFHEIANVCGIKGIEYFLNYGELLPLDIFGMAPSCVPATPLETSGTSLDANDLKRVLQMKNIIGLGEMMNYPGVISSDPSVLAKLALFRGKRIDGHSPGLSGKELNAYLAAGILSDHECTSLEEAEEKLRLGMYLMIREGSSEKNLESLLPAVRKNTFKRCMLVADDRNSDDLLNDGDVDAVVRKAITLGLDAVRAIQMATINPAEYFRLDNLGAIAPGYRANLLVVEELNKLNPEKVFYDGRLVALKGELMVPLSEADDRPLRHTVNMKPFRVEELAMPAKGPKSFVIDIVKDQIITKKVEEKPKIRNGLIETDTDRDILKLVVVERHKATGNMGIALVKGFGIKNGALASSIAHDSHNILSVGSNDHDIFQAILEIQRLQGGLSVVADGRVLGSFALPIAGLLSDESLEKVARKIKELKILAKGLGCTLDAPFDTLSFLALPVIPEIRLTDLGMVDVTSFRLLDKGREESIPA